MADWYYKVMGQEMGPVSSSRLKQLALSGQITRDSHVRKGPEGDWVLAERVRGLFESASDATKKAPKAAARPAAPSYLSEIVSELKAVRHRDEEMPRQPGEVLCTNCLRSFRMPARRSFLGFPTYTCPACHSEVRYPLSSGWRVIWWITFVFMVLAILSALARQAPSSFKIVSIILPLVAAIASMVAFRLDYHLRKKMAELKEHHPSGKSLPSDVDQLVTVHPRADPSGQQTFCPRCDAANPSDRPLCGSCGAALGGVCDLALASLWCGILSILVLPALPGLVLGTMALKRIKESGQRLSGRGYAIAGVCLSGTLAALFAVGLLVLGIIFIKGTLAQPKNGGPSAQGEQKPEGSFPEVQAGVGQQLSRRDPELERRVVAALAKSSNCPAFFPLDDKDSYFRLVVRSETPTMAAALRSRFGEPHGVIKNQTLQYDRGSHSGDLWLYGRVGVLVEDNKTPMFEIRIPIRDGGKWSLQEYLPEALALFPKGK